MLSSRNAAACVTGAELNPAGNDVTHDSDFACDVSLHSIRARMALKTFEQSITGRFCRWPREAPIQHPLPAPGAACVRASFAQELADFSINKVTKLALRKSALQSRARAAHGRI